jgi:hypothetical protein
MTWKPERGDVLVGVVEEVLEVESRYGPTRVAHVRDEESGTLWALWLSHRILRELWNEHEPMAGAVVHVCFEGKRDHDDYSMCHYAMAVDHRL